MKIAEILRKKDAYSVFVAIVLALVVNSFIYSLATIWTSKIITVESDAQLLQASNGWRLDYLSPLVAMLISLVLLEVIIRVVLYVVTPSKRSK